MQILLALIAAGLFVFAGYSIGRSAGYEDLREGGELAAPKAPGAVQIIVLAGLGALAAGSAFALGGRHEVRIPTPARLEELAGRAEAIAVEKAEEIATESSRS